MYGPRPCPSLALKVLVPLNMANKATFNAYIGKRTSVYLAAYTDK